jgi:predicted alpha/beta superfamily hydrolase
MEEIQQSESYDPGSAAGVIRAQTATGDLRLHEFRSRIFHNTRFLRVWLPPGYDDAANAGRRYPVLYLNDGQNLFEASTSFNGVEWQVDETGDRLIREPLAASDNVASAWHPVSQFSIQRSDSIRGPHLPHCRRA